MSRLPFELFLALRYLRPKRTFVSVITLISVIGVALGVWALIVVISVMTGFDQQLREKILGRQKALEPVAFLTIGIESNHGRRPLRSEPVKDRWLFLYMNSHGNEILSDEARDAFIGIHLGIQPSATASHRCRAEIY